MITGYGLNCEAESKYAWEQAGATVAAVHFNDLLADPDLLKKFSALMFIGGFSYGDHMGSGHVMALRIRHKLQDALAAFIADGKLVIGICNGFQVMAKLGLVPGLDNDYFSQKLVLTHNDCGCFQNFWVHVKFEDKSPCVFTRGLDVMPLPIRHGEGKVFTQDAGLLDRMESLNCVAARYADPETGAPAMDFPMNPNGSLNAIAGLCDPSGRVFGMMPHPEAYLFPENHPNWDAAKLDGVLPDTGLGLKIFQNGVDYMNKS